MIPGLSNKVLPHEGTDVERLEKRVGSLEGRLTAMGEKLRADGLGIGELFVRLKGQNALQHELRELKARVEKQERRLRALEATQRDDGP